MKLIIDSGNSFVKVAVFKEQIIVDFQRYSYDEFPIGIANTLEKYASITKVIISSVSDYNFNFLKHTYTHLNFLTLTHQLQFPFKNFYRSPHTLGKDRIALVAAATLLETKPTLIIDAGSCITYDFLDDQQNYLGGNIAPGLAMRYRSLCNYTAKLPDLSPSYPETLIGDTTSNAIHAGVTQGLIYEIKGVIEDFESRYENSQIVLTGGNAIFLSKRLKSSIFVDLDFLIKGLNLILDLNTSSSC